MIRTSHMIRTDESAQIHPGMRYGNLDPIKPNIRLNLVSRTQEGFADF